LDAGLAGAALHAAVCDAPIDDCGVRRWLDGHEAGDWLPAPITDRDDMPARNGAEMGTQVGPERAYADGTGRILHVCTLKIRS
jgi:hypothetical protein